jgi:hypothetical protein
VSSCKGAKGKALLQQPQSSPIITCASIEQVCSDSRNACCTALQVELQAQLFASCLRVNIGVGLGRGAAPSSPAHQSSRCADSRGEGGAALNCTASRTACF